VGQRENKKTSSFSKKAKELKLFQVYLLRVFVDQEKNNHTTRGVDFIKCLCKKKGLVIGNKLRNKKKGGNNNHTIHTLYIKGGYAHITFLIGKKFIV